MAGASRPSPAIRAMRLMDQVSRMRRQKTAVRGAKDEIQHLAHHGRGLALGQMAGGVAETALPQLPQHLAQRMDFVARRAATPEPDEVQPVQMPAGAL